MEYDFLIHLKIDEGAQSIACVISSSAIAWI